MILREMISLLPKAVWGETTVKGNLDVDITGLNLCDRATEKERVLSYATSSKYSDVVREKKNIVGLIVQPKDADAYEAAFADRNSCLIIVQKPEILFYNIHETLCKTVGFYENYDFESRIGNDCNIDKTVVIEPGVIIGNNVTIGPNTVVRSGSIIEDNTIIGCNTTIGSHGFQLITDGDNPPMHITHVGRCHICSNVYVGDNTCICNSLFDGETYIGSGAKIDNLVHIAHNLYVGKNAVITAHVILCGSARIEEAAWIAPNVSILNRVTIGKGAKVGLGSVVTRSVEPYTVVYGSPAKVHDKH